MESAEEWALQGCISAIIYVRLNIKLYKPALWCTDIYLVLDPKIKANGWPSEVTTFICVIQ